MSAAAAHRRPEPIDLMVTTPHAGMAVMARATRTLREGRSHGGPSIGDLRVR
jgi:hypothetical protein